MDRSLFAKELHVGVRLDWRAKTITNENGRQTANLRSAIVGRIQYG
jgi:hypothetical protein